jgi:two-component system nitrate/nitrite response regulator NarL
MFADALKVVLESAGYDVVAAASPQEAAVYADRTSPEVCLMDLTFPGQTDGVEGARMLRERHPECHVIMLSAGLHPEAVRRALAAGVSGFLRKDQDVDDIMSAVRRVTDGDVVIDAGLLRSAIGEPPAQEPDAARLLQFLTARERDVLVRLVRGQNARVMAEEMHVSYSTARTHIQSVLSKLGVHSRLEAAALAVANGLVDIGSTGNSS